MEPDANTFCFVTEFVNDRGDECLNCTELIGYGSGPGDTLHMDSYYDPDAGCFVSGGIVNEDNFGNYHTKNPDFAAPPR